MSRKQENNLKSALIDNISDLNENEALAIVHARLVKGDDPIEIVKDSQEGLRQVGIRYEEQEYFLSGLIMAGEIFRQVMEILQPIIEKRFNGNENGIILIGTVKGDIHDIGKNNINMLFSSYGFTVYDLGVDVPPSEFLLQAIQIKPDIVGLSGLITSSFDAMKETITLLRTAPEKNIASIPIIIGGSQLDEQIRVFVGADYWVNDAMTGVRLCQELLKLQGTTESKN